MKLSILAVAFVFIFSSRSFSQDIITKVTGEDIRTKVLEVRPTEIKYLNFDNQSGPVYFLPTIEVLIIRYENGTKDIFNTKIVEHTDTVISQESQEQLGRQGTFDAIQYYEGYKPASTTTFVVGLLSPLAGLIPAITCASTPPKDLNLNYPNRDLMNYYEYSKAYKAKAKKIKKERIWKNWGIAFAVNLIAAVALINSEAN